LRHSASRLASRVSGGTARRNVAVLWSNRHNGVRDLRNPGVASTTAGSRLQRHLVLRYGTRGDWPRARLDDRARYLLPPRFSTGQRRALPADGNDGTDADNAARNRE